MALAEFQSVAVVGEARHLAVRVDLQVRFRLLLAGEVHQLNSAQPHAVAVMAAPMELLLKGE